MSYQNKKITQVERKLKKRCFYCGSMNGIETMADEDQKPHKYRLDCADCGRYIKWIGKEESLLVQLNLL